MTAFRITWLSSNQFRDSWPIVLSGVNSVVAPLTDNQRLATTLCHGAHPRWGSASTVLVQVSELADVMDFNPVAPSAQFACLRQQPLEHFSASTPDWLQSRMMFSTVVAVRISRTSQFAVHRGYLCSFALCAVLPRALVGRHSHDYYEHSVTVGLAPRR